MGNETDNSGGANTNAAQEKPATETGKVDATAGARAEAEKKAAADAEAKGANTKGKDLKDPAPKTADGKDAVITRDAPDQLITSGTAREQQIAQANEHMKRVSENPDHAKAMEKVSDTETQVYERLADAPPATGRARDENTPVAIGKDGSRQWA